MPKLPRRKTPDFAAEGMLRGLRGRKRAARLELLEHLYRQGIPLEELKQAIAEDRLALLPAERVLADKQKYTAAQVIKRAGIELDLFVDQRRAAGLPLAPRGRGGLSPTQTWLRRAGSRTALDAGLDATRCWRGRVRSGEAASEAAAAARALVGESFIRPGDTEHDVGLRIAEAARTLQPQTVKTLQYLYETHLREQVRNDVVGGRGSRGRDARRHAPGGGLLRRPGRFHEARRAGRAGGPGSGGEALSACSPPTWRGRRCR